MTVSLFGDILGFAGAVTILAAYAYQTLFKRPADTFYYLGNLLGASLLAGSLTIHYNLASLCLEAAWASIALYGLIGRLRTPH